MKFWKRWIADIRAKTVGCSLAELGAYDRLLDEYYLQENPLPIDRAALYRICSAMTAVERSAVDRVVVGFFVESDGQLHNKRADEYLQQELGVRKEQSEKGREGAMRRWAPKAAKPKGNGAKLPADDGFPAFWATYPRHIAKALALKAWIRLAPDSALQAAILEALGVQCKSEQWRRDGGKFIPHAATWLNARRWEDESPAPAKPADRPFPI